MMSHILLTGKYKTKQEWQSFPFLSYAIQEAIVKWVRTLPFIYKVRFYSS